MLVADPDNDLPGFRAAAFGVILLADCDTRWDLSGAAQPRSTEQLGDACGLPHATTDPGPEILASSPDPHCNPQPGVLDAPSLTRIE